MSKRPTDVQDAETLNTYLIHHPEPASAQRLAEGLGWSVRRTRTALSILAATCRVTSKLKTTTTAAQRRAGHVGRTRVWKSGPPRDMPGVDRRLRSALLMLMESTRNAIAMLDDGADIDSSALSINAGVALVECGAYHERHRRGRE